MGFLIDSTALIHGERERQTPGALIAVPVVPLTLQTMRIFGRPDASLAARGKRLPPSDLLIAGTALARDDEIVTGNPRHFDRIPRLVVHRYP